MKRICFMFFCLTLLLAPMSKGMAAAKTQEKAPVTYEEQQASKEKMVPVAFIILDQTGEANSAVRRSWKQSVRQAYRVPYYTLVEDMKAAISAQELIGARNTDTAHLDENILGQIAQEGNVRVVALMIIHRMDQQIINGLWHWHDGPNTYVRSFTSADLYIYKADTKHWEKKIVRDISTNEIGLDEKPERRIKYAMMNLANRMEGRPEI